MCTKTEKKKMGRPKSLHEIKKRYGIAILPSVYNALAKIAHVERISTNELMGRALAEYVSRNSDKLKLYDKLQVDVGTGK